MGGTNESGDTLPITMANKHRFKCEFDATFSQEEKYQENKPRSYALLIEHCMPTLNMLLKDNDSWDVIDPAQYSIRLLRLIRGFCCEFNSTKQTARGIMEVEEGIFLFWQQDTQSNDEYFKQFKTPVDTVEGYGCGIKMSRALVNKELAKMGADQQTFNAIRRRR
jgi:hypothetical protein